MSNIHAGFVVNKGNATAKEILELIEHIKCEVYKNLIKNRIRNSNFRRVGEKMKGFLDGLNQVQK